MAFAASALGIDVGTTNVKVALVRDDGTAVATAQRPLPMTRSGDLAEQDGAAVWSALAEAAREVTAAAPDDARAAIAVGVCSQYSSVVAIDEATRPLAPMIMWQDTRGTDRSLRSEERRVGK